MKYGVGIDTGGTYTDAVVYDFETQEVVDYTKALTTREDLSVGILAALDGLEPALLRQVSIVSLSTTLATNACVENRGGRAKLLFIGVDPKTVEWVGPECGLSDPEKIRYIRIDTMDAGVSFDSAWASFAAENREWLADADALGIVQLNAQHTSAVFEKQAKELVGGEYDIPVVCGHELFCDLNAIRRGAGALLNGRLIPVLAEFLAAIKRALGERNIAAPVAIVRSDGSLMSERFTGVRPVETILCGPAASVVGANALLNEKNAVIVDMGGTTTDIALIRGGMPVKAAGGIAIGSWRTFVKGVYVETIGLGGDSAVRCDSNGRFLLDTTRVIPLCVAASRWPGIIPALRLLLNTKERHTCPLHEFFVLLKNIRNNRRYTEEEQRFCCALEGRPLIYTDAARADGKDLYRFNTDRLEREGIVMRCGLTPTDIMHIRGDFQRYNTEAARLGAQFVANSLGIDVEALCGLVYGGIKQRLYSSIVRMLLKENMPELKQEGGIALAALICRSWEMSQGMHAENLAFRFTTGAILVGVGAPTHIFLPDVARALGTRCEVPRLAGVANAVGAIAGNITASSFVLIKPREEDYLVYSASIHRAFAELDEATAAACEAAERDAREEAVRRGAAGEIAVTVEVMPLTAKLANGDDILIESRAVATAIGKIGLKQ